MSIHKSIYIQYSSYPKEIVELYDELVGRHDHLRETLCIRFQAVALTPKISDKKIQSMVIRIREATLWFLTIEFYSRFLSDPLEHNNSKRCLLALLRAVDAKSDQKVEGLFIKFKVEEDELINFIKVQRNKYFSHADQVSWNDFPRVFDEEYKKLLNRVADILDYVREVMNLQRICKREFITTSIFKENC